ncbi:transporter [Rhodosalinus halophilus]|uniref:Transporter n=1 Tax=Rhodosalinus halophilus TaxID=2259333 RepID=A0A365UAY0_9RHOB|nr:AEC family transporter [Rhodosalinus halophilus]RBI85457.1 transporter [Rhodosalinus halophilus]
MLEILAITFPIFALVALGYGSVRFGAFQPSDMRALGLFVMNVALPALLFNAVAERSLTETLSPAYLSVFLAGGLATIVVTWLWHTARGTGPARKAIAVMGSTCPNSGYVGYPLMLLLLPEQAGLILAMNLVVENFVLIPLTLLLLEGSRPRDGAGLWSRLSALFWGVIRRPMVLGLIAGVAVSLAGLSLPSGFTRLLDLLAQSTGAIALFVIGGSLVGLPIKGNRSLAAEIVAGKLLVHPALTALALVFLPLATGLPLINPDLQMAVILSAAMPMFGIYALLAQDYGHEGIASLALLGATAGAFFTLTGLLAILS